MELIKARKLIESLIKEHLDKQGRFGWSIVFQRYDPLVPGECVHDDLQLIFHRETILALDEESVKQIAYHEIAHAQVGPDNGHNDYWLCAARALGYKYGEGTPGHMAIAILGREWI